MLHFLHHSTTSACDHTQFHIALPWLFHITFHVTLQYSTTFYIPPLTTSRITPPPLPRIAPCHSPHCLIPHRTTFHIPSHRTHANPHHATTFHNPIPVWETELCVIRFVMFFHTHKPSIPHTKPNTKMVVKKWNFIHKVPEKVIPVCPNINLFWVVVFLIQPSVCRTDMLHAVTHKLWSHLLQGWVSDSSAATDRFKLVCAVVLTAGFKTKNTHAHHIGARAYTYWLTDDDDDELMLNVLRCHLTY